MCLQDVYDPGQTHNQCETEPPLGPRRPVITQPPGERAYRTQGFHDRRAGTRTPHDHRTNDAKSPQVPNSETGCNRYGSGGSPARGHQMPYVSGHFDIPPTWAIPNRDLHPRGTSHTGYGAPSTTCPKNVAPGSDHSASWNANGRNWSCQDNTERVIGHELATPVRVMKDEQTPSPREVRGTEVSTAVGATRRIAEGPRARPCRTSPAGRAPRGAAARCGHVGRRCGRFGRGSRRRRHGAAASHGTRTARTPPRRRRGASAANGPNSYGSGPTVWISGPTTVAVRQQRESQKTLPLSDMWRWRESNPRPTVRNQGFSVRSPLCFSQPRRSRGQVSDGLSHCVVSLFTP